MKVIAHRGASGHAPENTKSSILKSIELGSHGLEVDLQLTKDKKVVVFHDWTSFRTGKVNKFIKDQTLEELRQLDIGSWFNFDFKQDRILTLEELLDIYPENKLLNLEIKVRHGEKNKIEEIVLNILEKRERINNNLVISSFDHDIIKKIKRLNSKVQVGLLMTGNFLNLETYLEEFDLFSLHLDGEFISKNFVDQLNKKNIKTFAWTVNTVEEAEVLEEFGVFGVISNYPDMFKDKYIN